MSIGVIAATGASTGLLFADFSEPPERIPRGPSDFEHFVLVPRADWEQIQAARVLGSFARAAAPADDPLSPWLETASSSEESTQTFDTASSAPTASPIAVPPDEPAPVGATGSKSLPIWAEGIPDPVPQSRTRSADRLAAQVDELLRDLDVVSVVKQERTLPSPPPSKSEPSRSPIEPARPSFDPPAAQGRPSSTKVVSGVPLGAAISAADVTGESTQAVREEYESLLAQLRNSAEQSARSPQPSGELLCSSCRRRLEVEEHWESCPTCWRMFCPSCLAKTRVMGEPWFCPTCRSRPT